MNEFNFKLCEPLLGSSYTNQAKSSRNTRQNLIKALLSNRTLPNEGWDDSTILLFLHELSCMDTNNFVGNIGGGEREARIYSDIVRKRHFSLGHGIGRSGDISAIQPKAAGSSLINKLTIQLLKSLIRIDIPCIKDLLIFPLATGMAIVMTLLTLKSIRNINSNKKYIIWPRIDQKTCLKSMITAECQIIIVENILNENSDELITDIKMIEYNINKYGAQNILCILPTTSCFSPRNCDNIIDISKLCKKYNIPLIINNAYGLFCNKINKLINKCNSIGRFDVAISSTDKNFMVPVGGSIVYSTNKDFIQKLSKYYPGRASISPILDLFITLLQLGKNGYISLKNKQEQNFNYIKSELNKHFNVNGVKIHNNLVVKERVLNTPNNYISIGLTLSNLMKYNLELKFGGILFNNNVTGCRIVKKGQKKEIGNDNNKFIFDNYGSSIKNGYNVSYMCIAAAIGMNKNEIDNLIIKIKKSFVKVIKNHFKNENKLNNNKINNKNKKNNNNNNKNKYNKNTNNKNKRKKNKMNNINNININKINLFGSDSKLLVGITIGCLLGMILTKIFIKKKSKVNKS